MKKKPTQKRITVKAKAIPKEDNSNIVMFALFFASAAFLISVFNLVIL